MIELVQCIVVSSQGSLGLFREGKRFTILRSPVEFNELPMETADRLFRSVLGNAAQFDNIGMFNFIKEDDVSMEYTFVLRVEESALNSVKMRGFQWLSPRYVQAAEAMHPTMLSEGVFSTYRRAMVAFNSKMA